MGRGGVVGVGVVVVMVSGTYCMYPRTVVCGSRADLQETFELSAPLPVPGSGDNNSPTRCTKQHRDEPTCVSVSMDLSVSVCLYLPVCLSI